MAEKRGIGAICTVQKRFLHSKKIVSKSRYHVNRDLVENLMIVGQGIQKTSRGHEHLRVLYLKYIGDNDEHVPQWDNVQFYTAFRYSRVTQAGDPSKVFHKDTNEPSQDPAPTTGPDTVILPPDPDAIKIKV